MKEKISEIFKSKTFYIVFSIVLAIGAWLLVIDSKNPRDSRTIEVPISFVNKNVLEEKDLVDNSATTLPTTVTVKISGAEVFLDRVQPSDFYVEVDYNQVTGPGDITLEIKEPVCEPLGISVDSYYPMNIERIYDKTVEKYMDVYGNESLRILRHAFLNSYFQTGLKNLIDVAIISRAEKENLNIFKGKYIREDEIPFDFSRRRMSVVLRDDNGKRQLITKGAVDEILAICSFIDLNGVAVEFTDELRKQAYKVYEDNNNDGVAKFLMNYLNK